MEQVQAVSMATLQGERDYSKEIDLDSYLQSWPSLGLVQLILQGAGPCPHLG